eukprot:TRINITY_DN13391_c0_g1_i1.p1 TRINITY_DN13391_c0_g1~~TRINITY_DN13391_c0_g1_i1.p1  ORF type:complete len:264 (+),score=23.14 TRINITY_DN13391_c0_g1_i1:114-905(+)
MEHPSQPRSVERVSSGLPSLAPTSTTTLEHDAVDPSSFFVNTTLMPYQQRGLNWMAYLYRNNLNGILADEMGMGKTVQVIAFLAHLLSQNKLRSALVACPKSVAPGWRAEIQKRCPLLTVHLWTGALEGIEESLTDAQDSIGNIFLVSLDKLEALKPQLQKLRSLDVVILDEILHYPGKSPSLMDIVSSMTTKYDSRILLLSAVPLPQDPQVIVPLARLIFKKSDTKTLLIGLEDLNPEQLCAYLKQNLENLMRRRTKAYVIE